MGQQQLLLVILVTIIVGIATVVAINVFGTSAASANEDAVRQDILTIASSAQGWYIKPEMMGGGGNSFDGIDFTKFNFAAAALADGDMGNNTIAVNMNGTYELSGANADKVDVTGYLASSEDYSGDETTPDTDASGTLQAEVCKGNVAWDGESCVH